MPVIYVSVLERYKWSGLDRSDEAALLNAVMRGNLRAAYEYVWRGGSRETVKKVCRRVLHMRVEESVKRSALWLLRNVDRLTFKEQDGWVLVLVGKKVVGYLRKG